ncbi:MAG: hypothetical protein V4489_07270 [Chlamydiota bacterium]
MSIQPPRSRTPSPTPPLTPNDSSANLISPPAPNVSPVPPNFRQAIHSTPFPSISFQSIAETNSTLSNRTSNDESTRSHPAVTAARRALADRLARK